MHWSGLKVTFLLWIYKRASFLKNSRFCAHAPPITPQNASKFKLRIRRRRKVHKSKSLTRKAKFWFKQAELHSWVAIFLPGERRRMLFASHRVDVWQFDRQWGQQGRGGLILCSLQKAFKLQRLSLLEKQLGNFHTLLHLNTEVLASNKNLFHVSYQFTMSYTTKAFNENQTDDVGLQRLTAWSRWDTALKCQSC